MIPVAANDVAFSIHAFLLTAFTLFQVLIYDRGTQKVSKTCIAISSAVWVTAVVCLIVSWPKHSWLWLISVFNTIQVILATIKYIPQAVMHFKRKSTVGWSIGYILLDLLGGVLNFAQMGIQSIDQGTWVNFYGNIGKTLISLQKSSTQPLGKLEVMANVESMPENLMHGFVQPAKPRILLAASGSVAAIKFESLCRSFSEWAEVKAVATKSSLHFLDKASLPRDVILYTDDEEWSTWKKIGDGVLHIELRKWADVLVIAPLSANTLAKIAGGLCDNLLTCIVRAWDYNKPLYVAPAMNTFMWNNPFTKRHLESISELGIYLIPPITKRLACGDYGNGAMAEPSEIYTRVRLSFNPQPVNGCR